MTTEPSRTSSLGRTLVAALLAVAGVGAVGAIGALALFGWRHAVWVAVGSAVATLNLWVFGHIGRALLNDGPRRRLWSVVGGLKFVALLAGVYLLLHSRLEVVIAFAAGYAALPMGITLATLVQPHADDIAPGGT